MLLYEKSVNAAMGLSEPQGLDEMVGADDAGDTVNVSGVFMYAICLYVAIIG
jgi:hypothetical protein